MRRSLRLAFLATTVLAGAMAHATAARADERPTPADASPVETDAPPSHDAGVEEARALFRRGVALAQTSSWEDARSAFERSNQLRPHPVTLYNVAFCEQALGHYTLAARDFTAALDGDGSPGLSHLPPELETMARRDLQKIQGELSNVTIVVRENDRLLVDGRPLAPAGEHGGRPVLLAGTRDPGPPERVPASTIQVRLDPGFHVFRLFRENGAPRDVARTLHPAETTRIELSTPEPRVPEPERADEAPSSDSKRVAAYWALGVAGAGAVFAGTFGTLALLERSDLSTSCKGHVCGQEQASAVSRLGTYSDLTTAGLVVAGAGLAVGGYLLFTSGSDRGKAQAHSRRHDVRVSVGVGSVSVDGVF